MVDINVILLTIFIVVPIAALIIVAVLVFMPSAQSPPHIRYIVCTFGVIGFVVLLAVASRLAGPLGFILWVLLVGLIVRYVLISRETTAMHVFSTIGASMRQNLPLATALQAEGDSLPGKRGRILRVISGWLTQGNSLSASIRMGYPKCPGYVLAMVVAAERIDQVPRAVASIEAHLAQKARVSRKLQPINPAYPLVVVAAAVFLVGTLTVFVVPHFEAFLEDMGETLPAATRWLIAFSGAAGGLIFILTAILILVVAPLGLYLTFRPRRPEKPYMLSRIGDWAKWHLPVLHFFERNYSLVQTVSFLHLSLDAGTPMDRAVAAAAELDVNACYRRRLGEWLERIRRGEDVAVAAGKSRIGSPLVWAFDQQVNPHNTPAILESLESFYRSNYGYMVNLARHIFWPCMMIVLATGVGFVVYALFMPIVAMLEHTLSGVMP